MSSERSAPLTACRPLMLAEPIVSEIIDFLHCEAELLDEGRDQEWLSLLTEDVSYKIP
jgi:3-phenylpropionate/cinnamic acid dioxygenase small subunit